MKYKLGGTKASPSHWLRPDDKLHTTIQLLKQTQKIQLYIHIYFHNIIHNTIVIYTQCTSNSEVDDEYIMSNNHQTI